MDVINEKKPATSSKDSSGKSDPSISVAEFLDHWSAFLRTHKLLVTSICVIMTAIASGGYFAGYWTAKNLTQKTPKYMDSTTLQTMSSNLAVLSETTQSNFDSQSYFLDTLTSILEEKEIIHSSDAQRLLTGVIIYQYQSGDNMPKSKRRSGYEVFADKIRNRYHVTKTLPFSDRNPNRGIVFSSELSYSIICELVLVEEEIGLGVKDKFSIQVMFDRSQIPDDSVVERIDVVRKKCKTQ